MRTQSSTWLCKPCLKKWMRMNVLFHGLFRGSVGLDCDVSSPPLRSPRLLVESTCLMRWLIGWWRWFFFSSFDSLTDISACIFGHLSLMTAVCPVQERRRRFWFWWRAADCRVGAITLLPQSRLCVDWEARLSLEKNVTVKVKVPELKIILGI